MRRYTSEQQQRLSQQIQEDLGGLLPGLIRTDTGTLSLYATDASLHQSTPLAIVFPEREEDVATVVRYAADHLIPVLPRGSGTGLAGGCLGTGIVIDFSRSMNRIVEIRSRSVVVQPGVVLDDLNRELKLHGRYYAPDPSNAAITTIGGMIGVDAAGAHAVGVGSTRDHVKALNVVLSDGSQHELSRELIDLGLNGSTPALTTGDHDQFARVRVILRRLAGILKENEPLIKTHQPFLARNCAGYMVRNVLRGGVLDFPRLFVGSEGTLGICTQAELHTLPLPEHRHGFLLAFQRFDEATSSVAGILQHEPVACDLLDRRLLTLARESSIAYADLIPQHAAAALIVAFEDSTAAALEKRMESFRSYLENDLPGGRILLHANTVEEVENLWKLPRQVVPLLARIQGAARPVPFIEDIVVPPGSIGDFLHNAQRTLQRYQVTASLYAHAGSGQLHLRPFLELPSKDNQDTYESLARDLYRIVNEAGGSISGEHGDGLSRTPFIRSQYGPLYRVFQQIKQLFDPHGILNPDKIISGDPHLSIRHLRPDGNLVQLSTTATTQLNWTPADMAVEASACNGCGQCKTQQPQFRMCPFHHIDRNEFTSPRSKANTIRNYLFESTQVEPAEAIDLLKTLSPEEVLNSCFNCKQCQLECPSEVDIPHLWLEAKANSVQQQGLSRADWYLTRVDRLAEFGWRFSWLVNQMFRSPIGRWFLQKTIGIDSRRKLPDLASKPYLEQVLRRNRKKAASTENESSTKPVVLFVDYFANYHDPQSMLALEAILRHHDIPYIVPEEQVVSGMGLINVGDLGPARLKAEQNIRVLGPYAREGHRILCIEPASAVCLRQEYPMLLKHPDVQAVAKQTVEAGQFLVELQEQGLLKTKFSPYPNTIAYHEPCHQRSLRNEKPYVKLLSLIPELKLHFINQGCSGMAGHFGLTHANFETSVKIGEGLIDAVINDDFDLGSSECAACQLQMQHPGTKNILHPLKVLAAAYGLMSLDSDKKARVTQK